MTKPRSRRSAAGQPVCRRTGNTACRWLLAVTLALTAQQGWAQCSINVQGVNFGSYDTFSNQHVESTGNIGVTCDPGTSYTIALSPGGSGSYAQRAMASGAHRLNYHLYTDASRTTIWGDGGPGSALVSGSGTSANHTVYGRIPAGQNVYVGTYSDSIIVTLTF